MLSDKQIREQIADGTVIAISRVGRELQALTQDGRDVTDMIRRWTRKKAVDTNSGLVCRHTRNGGIQWRQIPQEQVARTLQTAAMTHPTVSMTASVRPLTPKYTLPWSPMTDEDIQKFVESCMMYKPATLEIPDVRWKYLIRSALRGNNVLILGPSGCGKTIACYAIRDVFKNRPFAAFNLGASQDPRGMLIGNTHYDPKSGTFFAESLFTQMIQTPGAIILLDEASRAHDDAANILMTVLDKKQRYLRIDEKPDTPTIPVAEGVVFLATANVGNEYTGARVMDRALLDRFIIIEMSPLEEAPEAALLQREFPQVPAQTLINIAKIAVYTRQQVKSDDPKINTIVSTRQSLEIAGLIRDGFSLAEAAEVCIYPFYPTAGGANSERTHMMQVVQKYLPTEFDTKKKPWDPNAVVADSDDNKVPWSVT